MTATLVEYAPLLMGALLLLLPALPPLRADVAKLMRKAFPRSVCQRVGMRAAGDMQPGVPRFTVLDAGLIIGSAMATLSVLAAPTHLSVALGLGVALLLLIMFDLRYRQLPNELKLPLAAVGVAGADLVGPGLAQSIIGLVGSGGALCLLAAIFWQMRGVEGIGRGDIKLVAAMGAWLGPLGAAHAIAAAAIAALVFEVATQLYRHGRVEGQRRIPFGAYLAGSFWVGWCFS